MRVWAAWTWAQRISFILLILGSLANTRAALLKLIDSDWRSLYIYRAVTLGLFSTYALLLFFGVLGPTQYSKITQWFFPLLFFGVLWAPMLHIWEERSIRRVERGVGYSHECSRWDVRCWRHRWVDRDIRHSSQNS